MKKIFVSFLVLVAVSAATYAATKAYFSDTESSTGNTFTAGSLDLKVDGKDDPEVVHIVRTGLVPYPRWSHSYGGQWILKNAGDIPGRFSMEIKNIKNLENTCNEPESSAGDVTCTTGDNQGELGSQMYAKWSRNIAPWGGWGSLFNPFNTAEGVVVTGDVLNPGDTVPAYLDLEWDTADNNNLAQTDILSFDVVFRLEQVAP